MQGKHEIYGNGRGSASTIEFAIPCHFSEELLNEIPLSIRQNKISETYGCLSHSILGHGRSANVVPQICDLEEIRKFRDICEKYHIRFNYLLNAPLLNNELSKVKEHITEVLGVVSPDAVTISSPVVAKFAREIKSQLDIHISTIAAVKTPQDLSPFLEYCPVRVIPHHDINRDFAGLRRLQEFTESRGIHLELLVNESCIFNCPNRTAHYEFLPSGKSDCHFQEDCNLRKIGNPVEFLKAAWIRPEDISWYTAEFGIRHFKISGREKPANWIREVVKAYLISEYKGNLIRLLAINLTWSDKAWDEIRIDNSSLDCAIQGLYESNHIISDYWSVWLHYLEQKGAFRFHRKSCVDSKTHAERAPIIMPMEE